MIRKRLQNRVAESRFAFPVAVVYAAVVWMMAGLVGSSLYLQLGVFAVSTLMMVTLNNTNALIRIYSRYRYSTYIIIDNYSSRNRRSHIRRLQEVLLRNLWDDSRSNRVRTKNRHFHYHKITILIGSLINNLGTLHKSGNLCLDSIVLNHRKLYSSF